MDKETISVNELKDFISKAKETYRFISLVDKYDDINELTPELLRSFVEKIYVSEKEVNNGRKTQKIAFRRFFSYS